MPNCQVYDVTKRIGNHLPFLALGVVRVLCVLCLNRADTCKSNTITLNEIRSCHGTAAYKDALILAVINFPEKRKMK